VVVSTSLTVLVKWYEKDDIHLLWEKEIGIWKPFPSSTMPSLVHTLIKPWTLGKPLCYEYTQVAGGRGTFRGNKIFEIPFLAQSQWITSHWKQVNGSTMVDFDVTSLVRCIIGLKDLALVSISSTFYKQIFLHRSQKRKKTVKLLVYFNLLGSALVKAACKMLVKSTTGWSIRTSQV